MIGAQDLLIGLAIVVFLFGAKRLPELASSLGKSMKEFKKSVAESSGEASATSQSPSASAVPAEGTCRSCQTALETGWTHCPRCGTPRSAPASHT